jgi:hypothetical protein
MGEEGKYRCFWPLADHYGQAIVKFLDRSAFLERGNVLRGSQRAEYQNESERL